MKIEGNNPVESQELYNRVKDINRNHDAEQKDNANEADDESKDRVTISEKAKEINEKKNVTNQHSEIRSDRVEATKKVVDSSGYDIDSMKVAKKVLDEI